jgi:antitoxin component of MazEF toxin-antitoxin module
MDRPATLPRVNESSVVATFRRGEELVVPAHAIEAAGIEDGQHVVVEPGDGGLVVRPLTAQEEVDRNLVEHLGSGEELLVALRRDLNPDE